MIAGKTEKIEQYIRQMGNESFPETDYKKIREGWEKVFPHFLTVEKTMPNPEWKVTKPEHTGSECWNILRGKISKPYKDPVSIYIHVPFCDRKCGFCDCHSTLVPRNDDTGKFDVFTRLLLSEIKHWTDNTYLSERPVTTVHFGGGTPNYLPFENLRSLIKGLRKGLKVTDKTEFALESTSSLLTTEHLKELKDSGFTRLHVGVQTLNDSARKKIGRRETGEIVLKKLQMALNMDFIVSVDIIYGLPFQKADSLINTLRWLVGTGIHGFSLYHLNITEQNRKFFNRLSGFERDWMLDYLSFLIADQFLILKGYKKNHFVHYAHEEDKNLYYNHVRRGEDLLALGPTSDGIFHDYFYVHYWIEEYLAFNKSEYPPIWGGGFLTEQEFRLRPLKAQLLSANIPENTVGNYHIGDLIKKWMEFDLIQKQDDRYCLTGNGSWFINKMADELMNFCKYPEIN